MAFKRIGLAVSVWFGLVLFLATTPAFVQARPLAVEPTDSRPAPTTTNPNTTYFAETGHYVTTFRAYWQKYGGLAQFGLPLTEEFQELNPTDGKTYTVQYFERNRFEYHPEFKGTFY